MAAAGEVVTDGRKAIKYIIISVHLQVVPRFSLWGYFQSIIAHTLVPIKILYDNVGCLVYISEIDIGR